MSINDELPLFFEAAFESVVDYADPVWDVSLRVQFSSPAGNLKTVDAFWDGDQVWRVRFSPDEAGWWSYDTHCSDSSNAGLHGQSGRFEVQPYSGALPIYRHGPLKRAENRRHLVYTDGTPFFWLADTAWNGILKAKPADWQRYLIARHEQGFTAVQCVMTQWRAFEHDADGQVAFTGREHIQINPNFYQNLDSKVADTVRAGLIPALVLIWACTPKDPGHYLPEADCITLARYLVARYGAYRCVWMLGGDGDYKQDRAERWRCIGRAVFDDPSAQVVTMHPRGRQWVGDEFREEAWFSFISYQSGHGDSDEALDWIVQGPPARDWQTEPAQPIINQEPCYEAHLAYESRQPFDAHKVRRALYWSLLVSPTAGVTYGHHGVWPWMEARGVPMDHIHTGEAPQWDEALQSEGSRSVSHLRAFFDSIDWWKLRPAQDWLLKQPGEAEPGRFVVAAKAGDNSFAVVYSPLGGVISLKTNPEAQFTQARWFNPETGQWQAATSPNEQANDLVPPAQGDWLLLLNR